MIDINLFIIYNFFSLDFSYPSTKFELIKHGNHLFQFISKFNIAYRNMVVKLFADKILICDIY